MSDYTPIVNYAAKDALITGNPAKAILGTEVSAEFSAIQTAIATKMDTTNDGTGTGFDADLLDGQHGTYYTNASNLASGTVADARLSANVALYSATAPVFNNTSDAVGTFTFGSTAAVSREQRYRLVNSVATSGVEFTLTGPGDMYGFYDRGLVDWALKITRATRAITTYGPVNLSAPSSGNTLTVNQLAGATAAIGVSATASNTAAIELGSNGTAVGSGFSVNASTTGVATLYNRLNIAMVFGTNNTTRLTIAANGSITVAAPDSGVGLTVRAISGTHSTQIADSANTVYNAGYLELPVNGQATPYTAVLADAGKCLYYSGTGAATFTIPANGSVAYPVGTTLTFVNDATGATNMTIAITTDTMVLSSAGTTGSRTLAQYGRATAHKVTSTRWIISGTGLT